MSINDPQQQYESFVTGLLMANVAKLCLLSFAVQKFCPTVYFGNIALTTDYIVKIMSRTLTAIFSISKDPSFVQNWAATPFSQSD